MKFLRLLSMCCICFIFSNVSAQEVTLNSFFGSWKYKSPKGKIKLTYTFAIDKKFTSITEHKEIETKTEGDFLIDKKGDMDRLVLTTSPADLKTRTNISYYLYKFLGPDTLKLQAVNDKQDQWKPETKRNTMIFVKKKDDAN